MIGPYIKGESTFEVLVYLKVFISKNDSFMPFKNWFGKILLLCIAAESRSEELLKLFLSP